MKKMKLAGVALMAFAAVIMSSCGNKANEQVEAKASEQAPAGLNIRYIDLDSITANYNLVKDYNEINIKTMTRLDNAQRTKQAELQKRANEIQSKVQNNGYISEHTYNADLQKFQQQQRDAETYLGNLQQQAQQDALDQSKALNDSLNNYIEIYMKSHNYDAILLRAAGVYFNPELDITKEIVDGLNARYIKAEDRK
ncbi:MAG: OmpH family outer membrane protein [Muribaculaceae bacterium]|nr:OmpH family outer membrane protein [Muribaculaceae bacterium]MDE5844582.1 OmpH family outer membrane protein [Muribaculaceae bacterium]MDE5857173.1 OmpH family outer membrane protein [Muribaculaceae bacterium]